METILLLVIATEIPAIAVLIWVSRRQAMLAYQMHDKSQRLRRRAWRARTIVASQRRRLRS